MSKSIYNLGVKEMRALFRDFACTLYGRTVFFIAYFVPFVVFLALMGLVAVYFYDPSLELFYPILAVFFAFITIFMIANAYFYHEVRKFAEKQK